ncbi:MAG: hypothetical protein IIB83_03310 [Bacteroidetes bacterium]|nr:hypothetical protein [Bacteroidota bacterium]
MKKLFRNYNYKFDKNDIKMLKTFCKQSLKQIEGDNKFYSEVRSFRSILEKLDSGDEIIKLTKDESTKLKNQLKQNLQYLKKELLKSWFLKKILYRSMIKQYSNIIEKHFVV